MELLSFIHCLIKLMEVDEDDNNNFNIPVFATHGASGAMDPVGHPFIREATEEDVDLLGIKVGDEYISIYIGN